MPIGHSKYVLYTNTHVLVSLCISHSLCVCVCVCVDGFGCDMCTCVSTKEAYVIRATNLMVIYLCALNMFL